MTATMSVQLQETQGVRLAIEGCGHGTLHAIYASVTEACTQKGWPSVDLLIIGGDFQAVRNAYDLNCVSMPAKYREMCDFHEYYSGQRKAPYLTIFVGGNHEASNYLFELYYGGWVAPNIYYMGAANVMRFGPLRIAAMSGIWKGYNYRKNHHERLPYNETDLKSIYHVRELDVRKLMQIRTPVDIGISHDWPKGVEWKGNWKQLFRFKKHFEEDARSGQLGSVAAKEVMEWLRPKWWFSAHLHCKYAAVVEHEKKAVEQKALPGALDGASDAKNEDEIDLDDGGATVAPNGTNSASKNDDEVDLDADEDEPKPAAAAVTAATDAPSKVTNADELDLELEDDQDGVAPVAPGQGLHGVSVPVEKDSAAPGPTISLEAARAELPDSFKKPEPRKPAAHPAGITNTTTSFLALDKCLPNRHFLQLLSIPTEEEVESQRPLKLTYDREWLAITRAFAIDQPLQLGDEGLPYPPTWSQEEYYQSIDKRRMWIDEKLSDQDMIVPENFEVTAPVYDGGNWNLPQYSQVLEYPNPQTAAFCKLLQIPNAFELSEKDRQTRMDAGPPPEPLRNKFERSGDGRGRGGHRGGRGGGRGGGGNGRGRGGGRGGFRGGYRGR